MGHARRRYGIPFLSLLLAGPALGAPVGGGVGDDYRAALHLEARGRPEAARRAYERVLAANPDHLAARRALGFERVGGRWLTGAALLRAKGFVRSRGRWLLAEEAPPTEADALRLRRAAQGLASERSTDRVRAAAEIARIGDERGIPVLVQAWARAAAGAGGAPAGVFSQTRQSAFVQDFDTEVC